MECLFKADDKRYLSMGKICKELTPDQKNVVLKFINKDFLQPKSANM